MKVYFPFILLMTAVLVISLPESCVNKGKKSTIPELKAYRMAVSAQDYPTAAAILTNIAAADSAGNPWVYDSLAFYHYFYLFQPGVVRNTHTAKYYANHGLTLNPNNEFLIELIAKLNLEEQKDTLAYAAFESLWKKTGDYTYWWDMAFIQVYARGDTKYADTMIQIALTAPESENKTVRLEHIQERVREKVSARAAFHYLRATMFMVKKDPNMAAQALVEALKLSPEFYVAKRSLYELQRGNAQ